MNHSFLFSKQFFETEIEGLEDVIGLILDVELENLPGTMAYGCPITEDNSLEEPSESFAQTNQPTLNNYFPVVEKLEASKVDMSPLEALFFGSQAQEGASFLDCLPMSAPKRSNSGSKYISFSSAYKKGQSAYKKGRSFQITSVSLPKDLAIARNESAHCLGRCGRLSLTSKHVLAAKPRSQGTTACKPTLTNQKKALISKNRYSTPSKPLSSIQGFLIAQRSQHT